MNARESDSDNQSNILHAETGGRTFSEVNVGQIFEDLESGVIGIRTMVMHINIFKNGPTEHAVNAINLRTGRPFLLDQSKSIVLLSSLLLKAV